MGKIRIGIDPGHGGSDPGAVGVGYNEKDIVLDVALRLRAILYDLGHFDVVMTRDGDWRHGTNQGSDLSARGRMLNKAGVDAVLSIHMNSAGSQAWGVETFTWNGNSWANSFGDAIHHEIINGPYGYNLYDKDRGRKFANFAILRETNAVAALVEMAFINSSDISNVVGKEDKWAETLARGICRYFNVPFTMSAKQQSPEPDDVDILYDMPILGTQVLAPEVMAEFVRAVNPEPKINVSLEELADLFLREGEAEGVRGDIAFAQSLLETGYFRYGGQVLPEQNNYAGIGAVNNSPTGYGAWFDTPELGVRAQIQHLKGYASTAPLANECVDPRYDILRQSNLLGRRTTWKSLSGSWAYPGYDRHKYKDLADAMNANADYGSRIIKLYIAMKEMMPEDKPVVSPSPDAPLYAWDIWERVSKFQLEDGSRLLDGTRPNDPLTRLEFAIVLERLLENGRI